MRYAILIYLIHGQVNKSLVYDGFRSLVLVKVATSINRIGIKTMNNNNTAGLFFILKTISLIIVIITSTLKSI